MQAIIDFFFSHQERLLPIHIILIRGETKRVVIIILRKILGKDLVRFFFQRQIIHLIGQQAFLSFQQKTVWSFPAFLSAGHAQLPTWVC
jgi:hypothetical protein